MRICFLIYSYFPFGGQQRDFMRVVQECRKRGHDVDVFAFRWQGEVPEGVRWHQVPVRGLSRQARYRHFSQHVSAEIKALNADCIIGFSKMPNLDIYFAADSCFVEKAQTQRGSYYRFTPRFRHFKEYEEAVFGAQSNTLSLVLSELQRAAYLKHYPECKDRLRLLPPGISPDRKVSARDNKVRADFREEFQAGDAELLILQVGSGFKVKGVDRSLLAISSLPAKLRSRVRYILVGQDKPRRFQRLAKSLGLASQVQILPGRNDIPRFFAGCDLLLHPAYEESAGYVLLEAAIAGLPVLTTASCGYASHIAEAGAGEVSPNPFSQLDLNARLAMMLNALEGSTWSDNGLRYGQQANLYTMPAAVTDLIEQTVRERGKHDDLEQAPDNNPAPDEAQTLL
jgi:UDP-glucose:(heptosyl)LPS alpha-1,3-glucosyltransferase